MRITILIVMTAILMLALATAVMAADDPFVGTWRFDPSKTTDTNPSQMIIASAGNGISIQFDAAKPIVANYDGKDYPQDNGGTISIARSSDHAFVGTNKRDGKITSKNTVTVAPDGNHLTTVAEVTGLDGQFKNTTSSVRIGSRPQGDAFLGTWQQEPSKTKNEPPATRTIKIDGNTIDFKTNRVHLSAKFDGKEYKPDAGNLNNMNTTWQLKRVNVNTIEIVQKNPVSSSPSTIQWQVKGNTLISTATGTGANGKPFKNVQHYEREK